MNKEKTIFAWLLAVLALSSVAEAGITVTPETQVIRLSAALENTATVTLKVSGAPADIDLEWSNYPGTYLEASRVSWRNFQGVDTVTIKVTRTSEETKSRDFVLRFTSPTPGAGSATAIVSSSVVRHPYALFSDIKDTPGYSYSLLGREPYASWHGQILADTEEDGLSYDFCGSTEDDSWRVFELALSYQMTEKLYATLGGDPSTS